MKLHFLGTTGYHPNERRHTACFMLPECGVVLDAGTGMFRVRGHLRTKTLDIFLTHSHLDHVVGLTFLFDVLYEKSVDRVTVYGRPDHLAAVEEHLFAPEIFPVKPPLEFQPLPTQVPVPFSGRVTHFPLTHPGGCVGYRIDWPDCSMAYITDTTASDDADYIDAIRGIDLLLHECYFPDGFEEHARLTGHSCCSAVAHVARKANVGRLVIVHTNPLSEEDDPIGAEDARRIFPSIEVVSDRDVIEL